MPELTLTAVPNTHMCPPHAYGRSTITLRRQSFAPRFPECSCGFLTEKGFRMALNNFAEELVKLIRLKTLEVIPIITPILTRWDLLLAYHMYEADAFKISTCLHNKSGTLISATKNSSKQAERQVWSIPRNKR